MKNILLIIALITIVGANYSQSRNGSTANEIIEEFWHEQYLPKEITNDGGYFISVNIEGINVLYGFNDDFICNVTLIIPPSQGSLNYYVERYNNSYVVISHTQWRMYYEGGYLDITLVYPDTGGYYFVWQ